MNLVENEQTMIFEIYLVFLKYEINNGPILSWSSKNGITKEALLYSCQQEHSDFFAHLLFIDSVGLFSSKSLYEWLIIACLLLLLLHLEIALGLLSCLKITSTDKRNGKTYHLV